MEASMAKPLAGHTNSYHSYSHDEALQGIAEAGYKAVELSAVPGWTEHVDLDGNQVELRRKLADHGLEPVSLSAHSDLTTPGGLEHGIKAVRWAAEYGIPIVNTAVGGHQSADENEAAFLANIGAMADEADRAGIKIGLEIHGDIMASGAVTLPLLEKIGRDCVGINYDTANVVFYSGDTPVEDIPKVADRLVHVHLKESKGGKGVWNFGEIGTGDVDFAEVIRLLRESGYDAPYSVEIEFGGEPWPPLAEVTAAMRRSREHLASLGLE
jgi:L-ribulose-5-phosphate 3-epimerase